MKITLDCPVRVSFPRNTSKMTYSCLFHSWLQLPLVFHFFMLSLALSWICLMVFGLVILCRKDSLDFIPYCIFWILSRYILYSNTKILSFLIWTYLFWILPLTQPWIIGYNYLPCNILLLDEKTDNSDNYRPTLQYNVSFPNPLVLIFLVMETSLIFGNAVHILFFCS